jgi:hypothetical protein
MRIIGLLATIGSFALVAVPAQSQTHGLGLKLTPYVGYMSFGSLANGPLGSRLTNGSGAVYGGQLTLPFTRSIGLYGNVAYSKPGLEVGVPILGGVSVGQSSVLLYDAGLQLTAPVRAGAARAITPFVQAGIGGMRYSFQVSPVHVEATNMAYNVGVGADIPVGASLGIRILAKDYIGKLDASDIVGIDVNTRTTHNLAATVGLSVGF